MRRVVLALAVLAMWPAAAARAVEPAPFGLACSPLAGVRFCPGGLATRVPSWDGVLLDVDVTLPATGDGPWPTLVLLNGLGGQKRQLEPDAPQPGPGRGPKILPNTFHHNSTYFASEGYAVLAFSSRGFGESCGAGGAPAAQLQPPPCDRGFVRIADARYEARDTQQLLGRLVDEGITDPDAIGVTGFSYGGGQAVQLAYLKDRVRLPDGSYRRWTSPAGVPLEIGAAYGQWLWSDLLASLLPNGRFLDFDPTTGDDSLEPLGVMIQSYASALFALADLDGYVLPPQLPGSPDAPWDLTGAVLRLGAGEPYGADVRAIANEYREFHGAFGIPGRPAPLLLESGWNDDVFPPAESLRVYQDLRARFRRFPVALLLGDYGHGRAANKPEVGNAFNDAAAAFFAEHLLRRGAGPDPGSVIAFVSKCGAADAGPLHGRSWPAIHRDTVRITGAGVQRITSAGGDPLVGFQFDPIPQTNPLGAPNPCKTIPAAVASGTAVYERRSHGFTMLGLPTIRATIAASGGSGQIAGRLWDVSPDGRQRLVTRGVYRLTPDQAGPVVFQLHGNGYEFPAGHTVKLELAGSDAPQFRASNGSFTVEVSDVTVDLPVATPGRPPSCLRAVRLRVPRGTRRVTVTAFGRRVRVVRGRALRGRRLVLRRLPAGRVQVRIVRRSGVRVRRFVICG